MAEKFTFIKSKLDALPIPDKSRAYYYDDRVNGLRLQITEKGAKSFQVCKKVSGNPVPVNITLGRYPAMTIDQARKMAQAKLSELADGINPNQVKKEEQAKQITLKEVLTDYLKARKSLKPRTIKDYTSLIESGHLSDWKDKPLNLITRDMVERQHIKIGETSEAGANLAMRVLRALFNFAAGQYEDAESKPLFPDNPVTRIGHTKAWYDVGRRQTVLKEYELKPFFDAVMGLNAETGGEYWKDAQDYFLLTLFTGLRLLEVLSLKWSNIDFKLKTLTVEDTKNKQQHVLPLSDYLFTLLSNRAGLSKGVYIFASAKSKTGYMHYPKRQLAKVTAASGIEFCAHDLRRTFTTIAERLDISSYAVKRLINHKQKGDVTAGYIIHDVERLRAPMQQITDYILKAAGVKASAEIIPLGRKTA